MRSQYVEPFPIIVAAVDARFDWRRSNNTKSNEPNFNCRRLWKEINCQSRFKCTTFKSSKECFPDETRARGQTCETAIDRPLKTVPLQFYFWTRNSVRRCIHGVQGLSADEKRPYENCIRTQSILTKTSSLTEN